MKYLTYIFFILLLLIGLSTYKDYGIAWDEPLQRDLGLTAYEYITGNSQKLTSHNDKYYGQWFELLLVQFENSSEIKEIYHTRHILNFLFFYISVIFFYKTIEIAFNDKKLALIGSIFLVLSPRIYAHAFFNSKDIIFMSTGIIYTYSFLKYSAQPSVKSFMFISFATSLAVSTRIVGLVFIIPALFTISMCNLKNIRQLVFYGALYLALVFIFSILIWPVMWNSPVSNFIAAYQEMSNYPQSTSTLMFGNDVSSLNVPWYYVPTWIFITTPLTYLALFLLGVYFSIKNFSTFSFNTKIIVVVSLYSILFPLALVIGLNSTLYNGWRQLYFIYPFMLLLSVVGFKFLLQQVFIQRLVFTGLVMLNLLFIFGIMFKLHPFQFIYFNTLAGSSSYISGNFDVDYWGVSGKQVLEKLEYLERRKRVYIASSHYSSKFNSSFVNSSKFYYVTDVGKADYYITFYPSLKQKSFINEVPTYFLEVNGITLAKVYKTPN